VVSQALVAVVIQAMVVVVIQDLVAVVKALRVVVVVVVVVVSDGIANDLQLSEIERGLPVENEKDSKSAMHEALAQDPSAVMSESIQSTRLSSGEAREASRRNDSIGDHSTMKTLDTSGH